MANIEEIIEKFFLNCKWDKIISQAKNKSSFSIETTKKIGLSYFYLNRIEESLKVFEGSKNDCEISILTAFLYAKLAKTNKAFVILSKIKGKIPTDSILRIKWLLVSGYIYTNMLKQREAEILVNKAVAIIKKKFPKDPILFRAYRLLGIINVRSSKFNPAQEYCKKVLNAKNADIVDKAYSFRYLGIIYSYTYNYYEALMYFGNALSEFRRLNDIEGMMKTLTSIGFTYINMGELELGEFFSKKALKIAMDTKSSIDIGK